MSRVPLELGLPAYANMRTYDAYGRHGEKEAGSIQKDPSKTVQRDLSYATSLVLVSRWVSNHAG